MINIMINNFKAIFLTLAVTVLTFTACEKEELPTTIYNTEGAIAVASNVVNGFFDLTDSNTFVGFDLATQGVGVNSVLVRKTFTPAGGEESAPIDHATLTPPSNGVNVTLADALNGFSVTEDDLGPGDEFKLYFTCNTADGRTLRTGSPLEVKVSCSSALEGTHTFTSVANFVTGVYDPCYSTADGSVVWTATDPGVYAIDDFSFGTYLSCYGEGFPEGDLAVNDICNEVTLTGTSQFGEVYTWNITEINGKDMTIVWGNDFGEGGTTILTNGNDMDWPPLFTP